MNCPIRSIAVKEPVRRWQSFWTNEAPNITGPNVRIEFDNERASVIDPNTDAVIDAFVLTGSTPAEITERLRAIAQRFQPTTLEG